MIRYDNSITAEEWRRLRESAGFHALTKEQAERGILHTSYIITAKEEKKTVAMARVLFDHCYTVYITDVIVDSDYQGVGIGKNIMEHVLSYIKRNTNEGEYMMCVLVAAQGKEGFYEKLGFTRRPNETQGAGMTMVLNQ